MTHKGRLIVVVFYSHPPPQSFHFHHYLQLHSPQSAIY